MTSASSPLRILIVDDEPPIRRFLRTSLVAQGYLVIEAEDGEAALEILRRDPIDVVVLDLGLPKISGFDVIKALRDAGSSVPIIVLSSRSDEVGKVKALDLGADDYVTKPFGVDDVLARIRAALRHRLQQQGERPIFREGDLSVDLVRRVVTVRGAEVKLTPREYDVLRMLVMNAGKVLTHKALLREVWGAETDVQYLRIYVRTLRQKIEADPERPKHILTEQGVGLPLARAGLRLGEAEMNLADLIAPGAVFDRANLKDKAQALTQLSAWAALLSEVDAETIEAALAQREALGSTGVGHGVAIPHARVDGLTRFVGGLRPAQRPIDFASIDGKPVDPSVRAPHSAQDGGQACRDARHDFAPPARSIGAGGAARRGEPGRALRTSDRGARARA